MFEAFEVEPPPLASVIPGVSDDAWQAFAKAMITAPLGAVSPSNALGMFELSPRRLADFGLIQHLRRRKSPAGRTVWTGIFVPPLTAETFLRSPSLQYMAFGKSIRDYANRIAKGEISPLPGATLSGSLAILHKRGPSGIAKWNDSEHFDATVALFERADGIF